MEEIEGRNLKKTPVKNDENTTNILKEDIKKSHSKKLVKKAKLSLVKKTCLAKKVLLADIDLNETDEFQENQLATTLRVKPFINKTRKSARSQRNNVTVQPNNKKEIGGVIQENDSRGVIQEEEPRETTEEMEIDNGSQVTCPTCQQTVSKSQMQTHISRCLKHQFSLVRNKCGGQEKVVNSNKMQQEYQMCQICQKDISHMNSTRRTQHVNRCVDESEKNQKQELYKQKLLIEAKTAILDCPICGKGLKTAQSRKSHIKKCAVTMGVPTDKVLVITKQQEEERQLELAAGILPTSIRGMKIKINQSSGVKDKKPRGLPGSKLDEDTRLALALSSSIADQQKIHEELVTAHIPKPGKKSRNKKNRIDAVPLILQLSKDEAKERIAGRITQLLIPTPQNSQEEVPVTPSSMSKLGLSDISVRCDIRSNLHQNKPKLWNGAGLADSERNIENFYVSSLLPVVTITTVKAGSKLKRMSAIPGRRNSGELQKEVLLKQQLSSRLPQQQEQEESSPENLSIKYDPPSPITQTAAVLAELAAEADASSSHFENSVLPCDNNNFHCSGFCPEIPVDIPEKLQISSLTSLKLSFLPLVNSPIDSDLTVISKDEQIHAHKAILRARCSKLSSILSGDDKCIDLSEFSSEVCLSVLSYVYAGVIGLYPGSLQDVLRLSIRLGLEELETICNTVLNSSLDQPETEVIDIEQQELVDLDNLWSSSDTEEEVKGHEDKTQAVGKEDIEEDDWQEMFYTQREKICRQLSNESEEDSGDDGKEFSETISDKKGDSASDDNRSIWNIIEQRRKSNPITIDSKSSQNYFNSTDIADVVIISPGECMFNETKTGGTQIDKNEEMCKSDFNKIPKFHDEKATSKMAEKFKMVDEQHNNLDDGTDSKDERGYVKNIDFKLKCLPDTTAVDTSADLFQSDEELFSDDDEYDLKSSTPPRGLDLPTNIEIQVQNASQRFQCEDSHVVKCVTDVDEICELSLESDKLCNSSEIGSSDSSVFLENSMDNPICLSSDSDEASRDSNDKNTNGSSLSVIKNLCNRDNGDQINNRNKSLTNEIKDNAQLINEFTDHPISELLDQPISKLLDQPISELLDQPINEFVASGEVEPEYNICNKITIDSKNSKKTEKRTFKFVDLKTKKLKNIQAIVPALLSREVICDASCTARQGRSDNEMNKPQNKSPDVSDKLFPCKRKLECDSSPNYKKLSVTPKLVNKRFKVSTPNIGPHETMSHYCSVNEHDSLYITPIDKRSRSTFMLTTSTSPVNLATDCERNLMQEISHNSSGENSLVKYTSSENRQNPSTDKNLNSVNECDGDVENRTSDDIDLHGDSHVENRTSDDIHLHGDSHVENRTGDNGNIHTDHLSFQGDSDVEIVGDNLDETEKSGYQSSSKFRNNSQKSQENQINCHEMSISDDGGMNDVWEGFHDDGFNEEFDFQTPEQHSVNQIGGAGEEVINLDIEGVMTVNNRLAIPELQSVITDQGAIDSDNKNMNTNFKTPTMSESAKKKRRKKEWKPPSPFTPMPNYDYMNTPQLKKEIDKFGLRPACKKRMKDILQSIYTETHQYETDSDCELNKERSQKAQNISQNKVDTIKMSKTGKSRQKETKDNSKTLNNKKAGNKVIPTIKILPVAGCSDEHLSSSQSSDISDFPEESFIAVEDDISDSNKGSKDELFKKLTDFIQANQDIYSQVLMYIPLEIDVFKKKICDYGLKCSMEKLLEFLDEKCINFTMKNNRKPRNQKRRPKHRKVKPVADI